MATFEDINIEDEFEEEKKEDDGREARLKAQRDAIHRKKQEARQKELETYVPPKPTDEDEKRKQELIRKGMAALNMNQGPQVSEDVRRKNLAAGIREAIA